MKRLVSIILFILLSTPIMLLTGCVRTQVLLPEKHFTDTGQNITVRLKDKRSIMFSANNFDVHSTDTNVFLQGKGFFLANHMEDKNFNGIVDFRGIENITSDEMTPYGPYIATALLSPIALVILIVLFPIHIKVG